MACIARRRPARLGAVVGSGGVGVEFVARGNICGGGAADGAGPKESSIETGGHLSVPFNSCGLCAASRADCRLLPARAGPVVVVPLAGTGIT